MRLKNVPAKMDQEKIQGPAFLEGEQFKLKSQCPENKNRVIAVVVKP